LRAPAGRAPQLLSGPVGDISTEVLQ